MHFDDAMIKDLNTLYRRNVIPSKNDVEYQKFLVHWPNLSLLSRTQLMNARNRYGREEVNAKTKALKMKKNDKFEGKQMNRMDRKPAPRTTDIMKESVKLQL